AKLGVAEGDRVALFPPNSPEWHVFDFAALGLGATVVPIYFRESPERMAYILNHSEAKVILVAGEEQAKRWRQEAERSRGVEVGVIAGEAARAAGSAQDSSGQMLSYEAFIADAGDAEIEAYRRRAAELRPDLLASIIYTSG